MSEPDKTDILALADRIEGLPAYSGHDLKATLYQLGRAADTAKADDEVILINEKWRKTLADALRRC